LDFEEPLPRPDGSKSWLRTNKVPLHDREGKVIGLLGTYEDITNRRQAEEQVRLTNEKLTDMVTSLQKHNRDANLLREMDDLLQVCSSSEEAYTVTRQYGIRLFPSTSGALYLFDNSRRLVEAAAVWGDNLQSDLIFAPEDCWTLRRVQVHQSDSSIGLRCKHVADTFSGQYIGFPMLAAGELMGMLHIENQLEKWENREVEDLARILAEHLALSLSNISLREKLRAQSIRDHLTGLFNRRYMEETFEREILRAIRSHTSIGVIMLDIDHFKNFNDNFGHEAGDAILQKMGHLLMGQVRGGDIACRFGGEEFILILPEASLDTARERAEQVRNAVKELRVENIGQPQGAISVSLGVAIYPDHGKKPVDLLQKVDKALYLAKHNGRDRVEVAG
jgi:diguanylate cyclase (GGDEF)-like protein